MDKLTFFDVNFQLQTVSHCQRVFCPQRRFDPFQELLSLPKSGGMQISWQICSLNSNGSIPCCHSHEWQASIPKTSQYLLSKPRNWSSDFKHHNMWISIGIITSTFPRYIIYIYIYITANHNYSHITSTLKSYMGFSVNGVPPNGCFKKWKIHQNPI